MPVFRFLLRFIIVPLAACVAVGVSILVMVLTHWREFVIAANSQIDLTPDQLATLMVLSPMFLYLLVKSAVLILLPGAIGVLIAEVFTIRSFLFHAVNGALSAGIGWAMTTRADNVMHIYGDPKYIIAAGLAAGAAYWLIAGWNAGLFAPADRTPAPQK
jgi:hypothetical protein